MISSVCKMCMKEFEYYASNKAGIYCSISCCNSDPERNQRMAESKKGTPSSQKQKEAVSKALLGKRKSDLTREKMRISRRLVPNSVFPSGENHPWWKGGVTVKQKGLRASKEYRAWRKSILIRDNYTCIKCLSSQDLQVDHVIPFALLEASKDFETLFDITNGRVLCARCHRKTETYARKIRR